MKINMTNFALIETLNMLNKFNHVTGRLGYAISKTKSMMENELRPFELERSKLVQKYGVKGEDGQYSVPQDSDNYVDFAREVTAIAEETVEIDFHQVPKEVFDNTDIYSDNCSVREYDLMEALFSQRPEPAPAEAEPETEVEEEVAEDAEENNG